MQDGEGKSKEEKNCWWCIEEDCFTRVNGEVIKEYLEDMVIPDQVVIKKVESSGSKEEYVELQEEEYEDPDNNDNEESNSQVV